MDRLIEGVNSQFDKYGVHLQYGTLSEYFELMNMSSGQGSDEGPDWPEYTEDFMPLATNQNVYTSQIDWNVTKSDEETEYWSGHYTTRPLMKHLTAVAGYAKHTSEIAWSLHCAGQPQQCKTPDTRLMMIRKINGALQHHDSITGTSKPEVTANLNVSLDFDPRADTCVGAPSCFDRSQL